MADTVPDFSSYFTISGHNLILHGASAAAAVYFIYRGQLEETKLARVISNVSQSILLGANVWHTTSSYVLFKRLPRSLFAEVSSTEFPPYFTLLQGLSGIALVVYLSQPSHQHPHVHKFRLACLFVSHLASTANAVFIGPTLRKLSNERIKMEKDAGVEHNVVGILTEDEKKKASDKNPNYKVTYRRFFVLHTLSAAIALFGYVANLANVAVTTL